MNQLVHGTPFQKKSQQQTSYHQQSVFWVRVWLCAWWQASLISSHLKLLSARIRAANPSLTASFFCWERCCCWPRALHPLLSFVVNGNVHVFHCISPFNHIRLVSQLQGGRRSKKKGALSCLELIFMMRKSSFVFETFCKWLLVLVSCATLWSLFPKNGSKLKTKTAEINPFARHLPDTTYNLGR